MKICITSSGKGMDSAVGLRFGRCKYFCIYDTVSRETKVLENAGASSQGGAGIAAAQQVVDEGVEVLITGNLGPNAMRVLRAAGVKAYRAEETDAARAVMMYEAGQLQPIESPVPAHFGMQNKRGDK
ncbi:MAG: NifB/NifX family molybdenum-iron cluster-binding protein [Clostridia bacterium]